ncbi:MAG: hypothetical protein KBC32_04830 [Candidatus Didemnitutus sp.]|nr:hypothetical protein [Candidatus Didemnitutus sp.]
MSLINDALKRAQRDRTSSSHAPLPHAAGASALRPAGRSGPPWLLIGLGVTVGGLLALVAVLLLRPSATPSAVAAAATTASTATPPPATASSMPVTSTPVAAQPATSVSVSLASSESAAPTKSTTPHPVAEPIVTTVATIPAASTPAPAPVVTTPAAPTGPARPSPRLIQAVEALRVTGIRAAGADSKVLMNDRVYRLGDIVDHELQIRLTAATAQSLTFVDETGASYTRNFN